MSGMVFTTGDRGLAAALATGLLALLLMLCVQSHILCDVFCLHEALAFALHDICSS